MTGNWLQLRSIYSSPNIVSLLNQGISCTAKVARERRSTYLDWSMSAEQRDADDKWDLTPSEDLNAKIAELHIGFTRLKENVGSFSTALDHLVSIRQENMRIESHNLSAQHVVNRSSATNDGRLVVTGDRVACTGVGCINFVCRTPWVLVLSGAVAAMIAFSRLARSKVSRCRVFIECSCSSGTS